MKGLNNMDIILVDSVKGGCGKTSISLKSVADRVSKGDKVCYIDLDLLGTSIEMFLNGGKFIREENNRDKFEKEIPIYFVVEKSARYYLNDLFQGRNFDRKFISDISILNRESAVTRGNFSLIACSPYQDDKERFKPSRQINYGGQIDYDYFSAVIEKILKQLYVDKYKCVVIDMPPNSDAYTDSLFNILLSKADSLNAEEAKPLYNVEIYVVNSFDIAHFKANCEWLKMIIEEHDMKWVVNVPELFKIVFNDIIDYNELMEPALGTSNKHTEKYIQERLNDFRDERINIKEAYLFSYDKRLIMGATQNRGICFDSIKRISVKG